MIIQLSLNLQKPECYAKTEEKFWNDPHISKGMLDAHLNPRTDAASRKPEFIDQSVDWISSLLTHNETLLDIGCGPGLYTKRLGIKGINVTGLDFSERSINYAKVHDSKGKYILQDYLQMEYNEQFDVITLIWCDYGALIPSDRINLLQRVHRALKPNGMFILDVFTPNFNKDYKESKTWEFYPKGGFWNPHPHVCLDAQYKYSDTITCNHVVILGNEITHAYSIWSTCFTPETLLNEIQPIGFTSVDIYSDVKGQAYTEDSDTLCIVLRKNQ